LAISHKRRQRRNKLHGLKLSLIENQTVLIGDFDLKQTKRYHFELFKGKELIKDYGKLRQGDIISITKDIQFEVMYNQVSKIIIEAPKHINILRADLLDEDEIFIPEAT